MDNNLIVLPSRIKELERKLKIIGAARSYSKWTWRLSQSIVQAVADGHLTVCHTASHCRYGPDSILHDAYPWEDPKSRSTFDECRQIDLLDHNDVSAGQQCIELGIWDGDNCTGERTERRVTYTLVGQWQRISELRDRVDAQFTDYCLRAYDKKLEAIRVLGAAQIGDELLSKLSQGGEQHEREDQDHDHDE